ncbi:hypothetical protein H4582DRAFT_1821966, partial [Lactarius indigo]
YCFTSVNHLNTSEPPYTVPTTYASTTVFYDSVASVPSRLTRHRSFNGFAADVNASAIPQWLFVTLNMFNDIHDTTIDFAVDYWLVPLLNDTNQDTNFNDNRTLTLLTFDETETHRQQPHPRHTTWGLGSLDCSNMNKYVHRLSNSLS